MFDLEQAVREWRLRLHAGRIRNSTVLQELECHLRDDIEAVMAEGHNAASAFDLAVRRLGSPKDLHREFDKISPLIQLQTMKHKFIALLTVITLLAIELAFALPALAHAKAGGTPVSQALLVMLASLVAFNAVIAVGARAWCHRNHAG